jgi:hypothetical protein
MISPKLAVLMATMAMIGVGLTGATPLAMAQQSTEVDIERNNEIEQSIEQSQEACTNEAEVEVSDDDEIDIGGENEAEVEQSNDCIVVQSQSAENNAAIVDESENTFDITTTIVSDDEDPDPQLQLCPGQIYIPPRLGGPRCVDATDFSDIILSALLPG